MVGIVVACNREIEISSLVLAGLADLHSADGSYQPRSRPAATAILRVPLPLSVTGHGGM
jgi:hypothetical protein